MAVLRYIENVLITAVLLVVCSSGLPAFEPLFYAGSNYGAGEEPFSIAVSDYNGDGHADLAVINATSDDVSILLGNGDGTFGPVTSYHVTYRPVSISKRDFDEDGHMDLVVAREVAVNTSILRKIGDGTFAPPMDVGAGMLWTYSVMTGDFDEDGHADLAVANWDGTDITILLGAGNGTFAADGIGVYASSGNPYSIETGDLDGDRDIDLVMANRGIFEEGIVSVLLNLTADGVSTTLQSFFCLWNGEGIEVSWSLSRAEGDMEFMIYRQSYGAEGFMQMAVPIIKVGELSYRILDHGCDPGSSYRYRVDLTDEEGTRTLFVTEFVQVETPKLALSQNFPNLFNPSTVIRYGIPTMVRVTIDIFDVSGRRITRLVDEVQDAGVHSVQWSGRNSDLNAVSSGVYFYRLTAGKESVSRKMILLR